ncbi:MAG: VCBS repeat-containing protein [Alphaproteobacteria bacterium]|nr:VCBS repeat-containing protein [Alphaproteobacteria bacterium]
MGSTTSRSRPASSTTIRATRGGCGSTSATRDDDDDDDLAFLISIASPAHAEALCDDGVDDDGDGLTDCEDPDCGRRPACCGGQLADTDGDGWCDPIDTCALVADPLQVDTDADGAGDVCDVCARPGDGVDPYGPPLSTQHLDAAEYTLPGDLDGDGDLDLLTIEYGNPWSYSRGVVTLFDGATRTYGGSRIVYTTNYAEHRDPKLVDLDSDGDLDLLVCSDYSILGWFEGHGDGTFEPLAPIPGVSVYARTADAADLDGDGDLDLIYGAGPNVRWLENQGGTFATRGNLAQVVGATHIDGVLAADLDGDGDLDLAFTYTSGGYLQYGGTAWVRRGPGGLYGAPTTLSSLHGAASDVTAADVDGDGRLDLATLGWGWIYWGQVTGFSAPEALPWVEVMEDLDHDGDLDLLYSAYEGVYFEENVGGRSFLEAVELVTGAGNDVKVGDIEPDGDLDLLTDTRFFESLEECTGLDTDSDGAPDAVELRVLGTDVADPDTDGGGLIDGTEWVLGDDPLDPADDPLLVSLPNPMVAGTVNAVLVTNATPGSTQVLLAGPGFGATPAPVAACSSTRTGLAAPVQPFGSAVANEAGRAVLAGPILVATAGRSVPYQILEVPTCRLSAVQVADFPSDLDRDGWPDDVDLCPAVPDPDQLDTDADGVGDACDAPELALLGVASRGEEATVVASGVAPGEPVSFWGAAGSGGVGPCPASLGGLCLDLGPSAVSIGTAAADATGVATLHVTVPGAVPVFGTFGLQATVPRGAGGADSVASPLLVVATDWDGDGIVDADESPLGTDPTVADTDGDGLEDGDELPLFDPLNPDTDSDTVLDGSDVCVGHDDLDDVDGDGVPAACDVCPQVFDPLQLAQDSNGDGLADRCEYLMGPIWSVDSNQARATAAGVPAGDVNGDGFADLLVESIQYDDPEGNEGRVVLFLGSPTGASSLPVWSVESNASDGRTHAAPAGDVNSDGFDDVLISDRTNRGTVSLYLGQPTGLATTSAWTMTGSQAGGSITFGEIAASAGDVNGDGFDDVVVGDASYDDSHGAFFLYLGQPSGLSPTEAGTWVGAAPFSAFGRTLAGADVNGDGYDDVVVGSHNAGASVFHGSATGLSASPAWAAYEGGDFGSRGAVGDVNGDGYADFVTGDSTYSNGETSEGRAYLYLGGPAGLSTVATWTVESNTPNARFGGVSSAGDVNGDGFADMLIQQGSAYASVDGGAQLFLGQPSGLSAAPVWEVSSSQHIDRSVGLGDVDDDGFDDVALSASEFDDDQVNEGRVWLYLGNAGP